MKEVFKAIWNYIWDFLKRVGSIIVAIGGLAALVYVAFKKSKEENKELEQAKKDTEESKEKLDDAEEDLQSTMDSTSKKVDNAKDRHKDRKKQASKYGLALAVFLLVGLPVQAQTTFEIDTFYGTEEVTIPEDTSMEEAVRDFARLYLEERHDFEEVQESYEELREEIETYRTRVSNLRASYSRLEEEYEAALEPEFLQPNIIASIAYNPFQGTTRGTIGAGATIKEQYSLSPFVSVGRTFNIGLQLGLTW